jgi:hypothetical protein
VCICLERRFPVARTLLDMCPRAGYCSRAVCGSNSAVECHLAKVDVAGSNPVSRSKNRGSVREAPGRASHPSAGGNERLGEMHITGEVLRRQVLLPATSMRGASQSFGECAIR